MGELALVQKGCNGLWNHRGQCQNRSPRRPVGGGKSNPSRFGTKGWTNLGSLCICWRQIHWGLWRGHWFRGCLRNGWFGLSRKTEGDAERGKSHGIESVQIGINTRILGAIYWMKGNWLCYCWKWCDKMANRIFLSKRYDMRVIRYTKNTENRTVTWIINRWHDTRRHLMYVIQSEPNLDLMQAIDVLLNFKKRKYSFPVQIFICKFVLGNLARPIKSMCFSQWTRSI